MFLTLVFKKSFFVIRFSYLKRNQVKSLILTKNQWQPYLKTSFIPMVRLYM